jgi:hypothetical protein
LNLKKEPAAQKRMTLERMHEANRQQRNLTKLDKLVHIDAKHSINLKISGQLQTFQPKTLA